MKYNPFNKPLDELTADDLNVLINNEVTEGYWIEYKSEFQESKKISKSIALVAELDLALAKARYAKRIKAVEPVIITAARDEEKT